MGKAKDENPDETPSAKPKKTLEEDVLAIMQRLSKNGIVEFSSRLISDKLGLEPDRGRQQVRTLMNKLAAEGKVAIQQKAVKEKGARKRYVYSLKENK